MSDKDEAGAPEVRIKFAVAGEPAHEFVASSSDAEALSFNAADGAGDAYSYAYTGKHDDGDLPTLREGGHYAQLARAMLKAKARARQSLRRGARARLSIPSVSSSARVRMHTDAYILHAKMRHRTRLPRWRK